VVLYIAVLYLIIGLHPTVQASLLLSLSLYVSDCCSTYILNNVELRWCRLWFCIAKAEPGCPLVLERSQ